MIIKTRQQAKIIGDKFYFTNIPCIRGHICERYTSTKKCVKCAKEDRKKDYDTKTKSYYEQRYINNKEHILEMGRTYKAQNIEQIKHKNETYYQEHKNQVSLYHKNRYIEVLKDIQQIQYQIWKEEMSTQLFKLYQDIEIPWTNDLLTLEDKYKTYVSWKIIKTIGCKLFVEYELQKNSIKYGIIDLYIPSINTGIEVKLDAKYWTTKHLTNQKVKYEQCLGEGNVLFVSPSGTYQFNLEDLLIELQIRQKI